MAKEQDPNRNSKGEKKKNKAIGKLMKETHKTLAEMDKLISKAGDGWGEVSDRVGMLNKQMKEWVDLSGEGVRKGTTSVANHKRTINLVKGIKNHGSDIIKLKQKESSLAKEGLRALFKGDKVLSGQIQKERNIVKQAMKKESIWTRINKKSKSLSKTLIGTVSVVGILAGAFKLIKTIIFSVATKMDLIGKTFGVISKNRGVVDNLLQSEASAIRMGKGLGDLVEVTTTLANQFGIGLDKASAMALKVAETGLAVGLTNTEAATLFGMFDRQLGLTEQQSENLIESTYQLAKMNKVAPQAVLRDMAQSAEILAKYSDGTGQNIAEAAIQAHKLGINLSVVDKMSSSLLNYQTSIQAQYKAEAMIGRKLNLDKARALALQGDLVGVQKEIMKQMGGVQKFDKLNVLQKRALAESVGLGIAELQKFGQATEDTGLKGAIAAGKFEDLLGPDSIHALTKMIASFKAVGAAIVNQLEPYITIAANLMQKWLGDGSEGLGVMSEWIDTVGTKLVTTAEQLFGVKDASEAGTSAMGDLIEGLRRVPDLISTIVGAAKTMVGAYIAVKVAAWAAAIASKIAWFSAAGALTFGVGAGLAAAAMYAYSMSAKAEKPPSSKMAKGGIVNQPTNALIGEAGPEAVIPLSKPLKVSDKLAHALLHYGNTTMGVNVTSLITAITIAKDAAGVSGDLTHTLLERIWKQQLDKPAPIQYNSYGVGLGNVFQLPPPASSQSTRDNNDDTTLIRTEKHNLEMKTSAFKQNEKLDTLNKNINVLINNLEGYFAAPTGKIYKTGIRMVSS